MKSAFAFFVLFLATLSGFGQNVPTMIRQVEEAELDSTKVVAYRNLTRHYRYSDMDSALLYGRAGLSFALEKKYQEGQALMMYAIAEVLECHGILQQAYDHYDQARSLYLELGMTQGVATATNGLGVVSGRTGKYDDATRYFLEALALYESIDNRSGIVQTHIKLGVVSDYLDNLEQALAYYLKAEELNTSGPSSNATLTLLNNIGIIYGRQGDLHTALKYFQKGLRQSDPSNHTGIHIILLGSLGLAYEKSGIADSAWYYQQQALSMARQNHMPEEEARSLVNLAALVRETYPDQSLELLHEALNIAQRVRHLILITEVYEAMIDLYKERNEYKLAMDLAEKRQMIKDSLFSVEKSREIANLQATQELARQENEIKNLALKNEKSVFQRNIMFGIAIISVAMIMIVWFYNTRISNLNTQLIRKQRELRSSNHIKDKLFSILGHDLRAPLNRVIGLLHVLALKQNDKEEAAIIEKLKQQSETTLETLDNLLMWGHNQLKGIRLDQQTLQAKDQIGKSISLSDEYASQKDVRLENNVPSDVFVYADPSHFDFVMRNLLSNAIKFSHAGGKVVINAAIVTGEVIFSIADSGIGIPKILQQKIFTPATGSAKGTWDEKGTGIGLMLCREYISENGGKLWVDSKEGKGSTFYFSLRQEEFTINDPKFKIGDSAQFVRES